MKSAVLFSLAALIAVLSTSCMPNIEFAADGEFHPEDTTHTYRFYSEVDGERMDFDPIRIKRLDATIDEDDRIIRQSVLIPSGEGVDYSNPVLALPNYKGDPLFYYPLMSYDKLKRPWIMFQYSGTGENSELGEGNYKIDSTDLVHLIKGYKELGGVDDIKLDVIATSYGGILLMLSGLQEIADIDDVVFESVPVDFAHTLEDMGSAQDISNAKELGFLADLSVDNVFSALQIDKGLYIYGTNDDGIREEDVREFIKKNGLQLEVVEDGYHLMRIRYPLSPARYNQLNKKMVDFLSD
jgi:hypothetical protein